MDLRISAPEHYQALRAGAALLDRSMRGRFEMAGGDRLSYLHGLLTNDVQSLLPGQGCYAALLTPQGRMISDMRVSELGTKTLIDLPHSTAETVRQRLADFIFSEDVEVFDISSTHSQLGVYGPRASDVVAGVLTRTAAADEPTTRRELLESMTTDANATWQFDGAFVVVVRSDDFGVRGFELFMETPVRAELVKALQDAGAIPVTAEAVEITRVEAGRPEFGIDMDEHTIPLEAGIEDRAISLTKGCYVGQEIIIRVLHRGGGRVAKHLVGLVAETTGKGFERGERLHSEDKDVGVVTSAVFSPMLGRSIGLGYVHRDHAAAGNTFRVGAGTAEPRAVKIVPVPFTASAG